jgi:predicted metal-dependent hydrolase
MDKIYKYSSFEYRVIRKKRKTIGIRITAEGEVIITSPFNVREEIILNIIKKKEKWITDKLQLFKNQVHSKDRTFKDGGSILYFGKFLTIEICHSEKDISKCLSVYNFNKNAIEFLDEKVIVYINNNKYIRDDIIRENIIKCYRLEAKRILEQRTSYYSKIINVNIKKITIKDQKTIWGSCSSRGNINYNYRLVMAPISIIDYVVVHELCHLIHMNHSKDYWKTVESILPDYEERRQWLNYNGHTLRI